MACALPVRGKTAENDATVGEAPGTGLYTVG